MANFKRTYINADEELVIQGKLTIEGELEQKEFVETSSFSQTNFSGDVLVVNADGFTKDVSPTATTIPTTTYRWLPPLPSSSPG